MPSRFLFLLLFILSCSTKQETKTDIIKSPNSIEFKFSQNAYIHDYDIYLNQKLVLNQSVQERTNHIVLPTTDFEAGNYSIYFNSNDSIRSEKFSILKKADYPIYIQIPAGGYSYSIYDLPKKILIPKTDTLDISISTLNRFDSEITFILHNKLKIDLGKKANSFHLFSLIEKQKQNFSILKNDSVLYTSNFNIKELDFIEFQDKVSVTNIRIPTNSYGEQVQYEENFSLFIADKLVDFIQEKFMSSQRNKDQTSPFCYLSFDLENKLESSNIYYGQAIFKNLKNGQIIEAFIPKNWRLNGLAEFSTASLMLDSQSSSKMILPIYIDRDKIESGLYDLHVELTMLGFDSVLHSQNFTLKIDRYNSSLLIFYGLIILLALIYVIYFMSKLDRILKSLKIEALITISIFAAIHFVFSFIAQMFDSTFLAFLGPFRIFISNFFTECLTYTILVSLFILYPKKGVISLKLIVSFLLSLVLTGGAVLLTVINTIIMMAFLEITFNYFYKKSIILLFIILGLVDAFISLIQIIEMKLFYRLLYSDWYIFLMMFIVGFIYTLIGSYFGLVISKKLKKVITV